MKIMKHKERGTYVIVSQGRIASKEFDTVQKAKKEFYRRGKEQAMKSVGLTKVRGALGGVYYE